MKYLSVVLLFMFAGCAVNTQNYANKTVSIADLSDRPTQIVEQYNIGIGDTLQINVWKNPDLGVSVPVRPDGKISAPLIGDMLVAGLPPELVADAIEEKLSEFLRTPNVAVIMTSLDSTKYLSRVRVTGAVDKSVSLNHQQGMTVLDAVLEAGGPNDFAQSAQTQIFRRVGDQTVLIPVDLDSILKRGNLADNIVLSPGDTITIPERRF